MVVVICSVLLAILVLVLFAVPLLRYRIGTRFLVISLLGIPLRAIFLRNIQYVSDHSRGLCEPWANTWSHSQRGLYLRKRRGIFRSVRLTPTRPFAFKNELDRALERCAGAAPDPAGDPAGDPVGPGRPRRLANQH